MVRYPGFPDDRCVDPCHILRLAFDGRGENEGAVTQSPGFGRGRDEGQVVRGDDLVRHPFEYGVSRLRSVRNQTLSPFFQPVPHHCRNLVPQAEFREYPDGIRKSEAVRNERPGSDGVEVVPDHVREHQIDDPGRCRGAGQLASLDLGKMLSDRVQFMDGGAAGQEHLRDFLFFRRGGCRRPAGEAVRSRHRI